MLFRSGPYANNSGASYFGSNPTAAMDHMQLSDPNTMDITTPRGGHPINFMCHNLQAAVGSARINYHGGMVANSNYMSGHAAGAGAFFNGAVDGLRLYPSAGSWAIGSYVQVLGLI